MRSLKGTEMQKGAAGIGAIIFNGVILVFLAIMGMKVGQFYFDDKIVKDTIESLKEVPYITKKSSREIGDLLQRKLSLNDLEFKKDEVIIEKRSDRTVVEIIYERRTNLISNIDVVVGFNHKIELVRN